VTPAPIPPPLAPIAAPTLPANTEPTADDKDISAAYNAINNNDIPRAQQLAATIRKRNPKHPLLASLNTTIETRIGDMKKRELEMAEATKTNLALEEEKKRSAAAVKEAEDAKAASAPIISALPGGGFIAPSAAPTMALLGEVERPAIQKVIDQWAAALATRDIPTISKVRSLTSTELTNWKNTFGRVKAYKLNVKITDMPQVKDDQALVPIEEIVVMTDKSGADTTMMPRKFNYRLHKVGGEWRMLPPTAPMP